ncbi:NAD(P)-dependent dehydrogenase (short-subunit alcohol dehydrogenase family) [Altererythrobacter atlanticus]|uniref:Levodione reductase n=1 Tax=Croceibacterium atlanticum TaxID=1267766 RepID=A0A0F7KU99_9SPHN|nr:SDR family oxidoreductase [Croceibacterium atlanticum]AKH43898.1 Levodione reductase [Croceibacterium atlanticum]MBB5733652.1 NAD(P)-dependent dehydrogenase (short-subunit alcohol dehydrogenase family) [Croceibacterium atlanticum]
MRFKDKVALVMGGNSGMGLATARAFAAEGAKVHITGRNQQTIDEALAQIPGAAGYSADISDIESSERVVSAIEEKDGRIDVLYINAGVGGFAPLRDITPESWDHTHSINLKGCVFALQKALRLMGKGGSIIVTGSIGAHAALPGNGVYAAAKGGLYAAMKVFAGELVAEGIRLNMVSPGPIDTPLLYRNPGMTEDAIADLKKRMIENIPMHRMGEADEVAKAVLFLASDDASFITAANLFVDGGMLELR